ncbi:3496_t:CDS:1, partial [Gigaspora rosea]
MEQDFHFLIVLLKQDLHADVTAWFKFLRENGLKKVKIILSDKDFTQISSGMAIWKNAEIQLCKWTCDEQLSKSFLLNIM